MSEVVKIVECPRDAWQGLSNTIPAEFKSEYLRELLNADDPYSLSFVEMLQADKFGRVRKFRVGDFRVFFALETVEVSQSTHTYKGTLFLLDIRNRREAY